MIHVRLIVPALAVLGIATGPSVRAEQAIAQSDDPITENTAFRQASAWQAFEKAYGPLHATFSRITGLPERIAFKPGIVFMDGYVDIDELIVDLISRRFLAENQAALQIDTGQLVVNKVHSYQASPSRPSKFTMILYRQYYSGLNVLGALVRFAYRNDTLIALDLGYHANIEIDVDPAISNKMASDIAAEAAKIKRDSSGAYQQSVKADSLVVYPEATDARIRYRLAWNVYVGGDIHRMPLLARRYLIDALTGEIIADQNLVHRSE